MAGERASQRVFLGVSAPLFAASTAWRLGLHCSCCCAGLMAVLLVIGVMDLRAMAVVTAAITVERLVRAGERVARAIGAAAVAQGCS